MRITVSRLTSGVRTRKVRLPQALAPVPLRPPREDHPRPPNLVRERLLLRVPDRLPAGVERLRLVSVGFWG